MARLVLAVIFTLILLIGVAIVVRGLRAALAGDARGGTADMAGAGTLPRIAYALLLALIVYVTIWGGA